MSKNLYSILELDKSADQNEIRKQYLKLSRTWHPDKATPEKQEENTAKFKEIQTAYEILSDEKSKAYYDQTGQLPGENGGGGPPPGFSFGGPGFGFGNIHEIFGMFGGGGPGGPRGGGGQRKQGKAPSKKQQIPFNLRDFYFGRTLQIPMERQRFCNDCKGEGYTNTKVCTDCNGAGVKNFVVQMGPMILQNQGPCPPCKGKGKVSNGEACGGCKGSKFIKQTHTIDLIILKGMKPGDQVVFPGETSHDENYTEPGDVIIELVAADEDHGWERSGDNLRHRVNLSLSEALCGKVVRLEGHPMYEKGLFIKVPFGVQNRQELVIEGLGMPRIHKEQYGDVILTIHIVPTKEEKEILEQNVEHFREIFKSSPGETEGSPIWDAKSLVY
jgi:DnaJ-class molecular chaperone